MNKVGIVILCRYNSSRFPGKILKEINGKPIIKHIFDRLSQRFDSSNIVIATSKEVTDNPIAEYAKQFDLPLFRGSLNNVAQRFYEAGKSKQWDYAIRINGDNLFIDLDTIESMIQVAQENQAYDLVSNVPERTFPYGMSIEVLKLATYIPKAKTWQDEFYTEHVTSFYYKHPNEFNICAIKNTEYLNLSQLKLAIDTKEDFEFAKSLINQLGKDYPLYNMKHISKAIDQLNTTKL